MRHLLRLTDLTAQDVFEIFSIADEIIEGKRGEMLKGKSAVVFFPSSSIRTRVTFEKGIYLLGGQPVLFPSDTLDKKEDLRDVCGYLNNWADLLVVRHRNIAVLERMAECSSVPMINAMTDVNHPCEILADLFSLSKLREDFLHDKYLFCGTNGNIGKAWKEASEVLGLDLVQCCGNGYELKGITVHHDLARAVAGRDIVCTDSLPSVALNDFAACQVTKGIMDMANPGALLNPCPLFYRGEEVSADAIDSDYFVGYEFKKYLLEVQQAVMIWCLEN